MRVPERALEVGSVVWAVVGAAVALASLPAVDDDARLLVGLASVVLPTAAAGAAFAVRARRRRVAGVLLLLSAGTPTYFAHVLNVPALVVGAALLVARPGRARTA